MIAMNDRLTSVYYSTKTNANTPDTFKALEQGFLGNFLGGQPHYYFGASQPTGKHWFDTSNITDLAPVTILYGHRECAAPPDEARLNAQQRASTLSSCTTLWRMGPSE